MTTRKSLGFFCFGLLFGVSSCGGTESDASDGDSVDDGDTYDQRDFAGDEFGSEDYAPCWLNMPTSAPVNGLFVGDLYANGCGIAGNEMDWEGTTLEGPLKMVWMLFGTLPMAKQTGTFVLSELRVRSDPNVNVEGDHLQWKAAPGVCTVEVVANEHFAHIVFQNRHDVRLRGSCSAPLLADPTTLATGQLTVEPFLATGMINPD